MTMTKMVTSCSSLPLLLLLLLPSTNSLLLWKVTVPPFGFGGGSAQLGCDFDSQGEQVYSVKWYKGGQEIFRYIPSNILQPIAVFTRPGVTIDQIQSNETSLSLTNLEVTSTGRYRCEVSTEAPMFSTESDYGDLLVIVLPAHPPEIIDNNLSEYSDLAPGDNIEMNCTSRESKPAADIIWAINGEEVARNFTHSFPITTSSTGLHTSLSSLSITLTSNHFTLEGNIRISCVSSIGSLQSHSSTGTKQQEEDDAM